MNMDAKMAFEAVVKLLSAIPDSGIHDIPSGWELTIMADENYSTVTKSQIKGMMKSNPLLSPPTNVDSSDELDDCDDFALQLKAALTARARQDYLASGIYNPPPAIGIIFSMNHALSVFIDIDNNGNPVAMLADASAPDQPITATPNKASLLLRKLPVRFIYI